jgi:methionyl aminopeptidase
VFKRRRSIEYKTPEQIQKMRVAGLLVGETLELLRTSVEPGMTTKDLDAIAEQNIRAAGGVPSFIGVPGGPGAADFPATLCTSVNDEIVHCIPGPRVIRDGDVVSVDCGAIVDGWHGDSAVTFAIGTGSAADLALSEACRSALEAGIAAAVPGGRLTDISHAVQVAAEAAAERDGVPYGIVAEYGGHGIGTSMHMDPFLPNLGSPGRGPRLPAGGVLAVEPMLTGGSAETRTLDDGWTVVTEDNSRAVHWEHTVAITEDGPWVLTAPVRTPASS